MGVSVNIEVVVDGNQTVSTPATESPELANQTLTKATPATQSPPEVAQSNAGAVIAGVAMGFLVVTMLVVALAKKGGFLCFSNQSGFSF